MKTLALLLLVFSASWSAAQSGAVARVAGELVESIGRRSVAGSAEAGARELAQFGGTRAVREVLEQAHREGGEVLMRQIAAQTEKHGVLALRALKGAPAPVLRALDGMPAELTENSLRALAREPVAMRQLAEEFGSTALETAARHPGLAVPIGSRLGAEGLDVARRMSVDQAAALSRHADGLARMPAAERGQFLRMLKESPAKTLAWMEKHPRLLLAGSATTAVVLARKEIFGEGLQQGLLERGAAALYRTFEKPVNWILGTLTGLILVWGLLKFRLLAKWLRRRTPGTA